MIDWFRKLMGRHVCEEFTQWTTRERNFTRPVDITRDFAQYVNGIQEIEYTRRRWQERQCTICGCIEQRDLDR